MATCGNENLFSTLQATLSTVANGLRCLQKLFTYCKIWHWKIILISFLGYLFRLCYETHTHTVCLDFSSDYSAVLMYSWSDIRVLSWYFSFPAQCKQHGHVFHGLVAVSQWLSVVLVRMAFISPISLSFHQHFFPFTYFSSIGKGGKKKKKTNYLDTGSPGRNQCRLHLQTTVCRCRKARLTDDIKEAIAVMHGSLWFSIAHISAARIAICSSQSHTM